MQAAPTHATLSFSSAQATQTSSASSAFAASHPTALASPSD